MTNFNLQFPAAFQGPESSTTILVPYFSGFLLQPSISLFRSLDSEQKIMLKEELVLIWLLNLNAETLSPNQKQFDFSNELFILIDF